MEFFANKLNGNFLRNVLPSADDEVDFVRAAIAYGSDASTLVSNCLSHKYRLDIWMRYDHTVPVSPALLRKLFNSTPLNVFCNLIPDALHSKVIWWKGYGVYVGSANLTERAWISNIEFGVFLLESDLETNEGLQQIEHFFEQLENCDAAIPLTEEIIEEQERIQDSRAKKLRALDSEAEQQRSVEKWGGPAEIASRKTAFNVQRERFVTEWTNGLTYLRDLVQRAPQFRPKWLNDDVPDTWQADQFLHAFYYNEVVDGNRHPFEEYYAKNKADPSGAAERALRWWSSLSEPPSHEDENCHARAPVIRNILTKDRIGTISLEEFTDVCLANHSTVDHVRRIPLELLGLADSENASERKRVAAFAEWLWVKRNSTGESVVDLLRYVFDGGPAKELPHRIFDATRNEERRLPRFGTNQVAELTGWARPELCPPRNGRTSKSLRALGYDVRIY